MAISARSSECVTLNRGSRRARKISPIGASSGLPPGPERNATRSGGMASRRPRIIRNDPRQMMNRRRSRGRTNRSPRVRSSSLRQCHSGRAARSSSWLALGPRSTRSTRISSGSSGHHVAVGLPIGERRVDREGLESSSRSSNRSAEAWCNRTVCKSGRRRRVPPLAPLSAPRRPWALNRNPVRSWHALARQDGPCQGGPRSHSVPRSHEPKRLENPSPSRHSARGRWYVLASRRSLEPQRRPHQVAAARSADDRIFPGALRRSCPAPLRSSSTLGLPAGDDPAGPGLRSDDRGLPGCGQDDDRRQCHLPPVHGDVLGGPPGDALPG